MDKSQLNAQATEIRRRILITITHAKGGHLGASLSESDILTALFFYNPGNTAHGNKDDCRGQGRARGGQFIGN
jgi:transketolase N-terminal domain/subunit